MKGSPPDSDETKSRLDAPISLEDFREKPGPKPRYNKVSLDDLVEHGTDDNAQNGRPYTEVIDLPSAKTLANIARLLDGKWREAQNDNEEVTPPHE